MRALTIICITVVGLSGCGLNSYYKIDKLIKGGYVTNRSFKQEIPFKEIGGRVIIAVTIKGRSYDFLFDTGAITVVDDNLSELLGLRKIAERGVYDYSGAKKQLSYVELDKLTIGTIEFSSIGAVASDTKILEDASCINVSGAIGANLMKNAIWQIDYERRRIILTDNIDSLGITGEKKRINFFTDAQGSAKTSLAATNGLMESVVFDTGSGGGITLPAHAMQGLQDSINFIMGYGISGGAFGTIIDTTRWAKIYNFKVGQDLPVENAIIAFKNKLHTGVIGNSFLRNYTVTFDWLHHEIILSSFSPAAESQLQSFGFEPGFREGKLCIGFIYRNSSADEAGLALYDQILRIDDTDYRDVQHSDYCNMRLDYPGRTDNRIHVVARRGEKEFSCQLIKKNLAGLR